MPFLWIFNAKRQANYYTFGNLSLLRATQLSNASVRISFDFKPLSAASRLVGDYLT